MMIRSDDADRFFASAQREMFVPLALKVLGFQSLDDITSTAERKPLALKPILIEDYRHINAATIEAIRAAFYGPWSVAYFLVMNPTQKGGASHPLLEIADQLKASLPVNFPVDHPMERHPEAVARFGAPDGTLKIYDLDTKVGDGYREQAETSETFDAHNDGLGYGGAVEAFLLYADSAPLWGGFTYFQNLVALSLEIARDDPEAFAALFLPDAITALRPRGKGAIRVTTPILFVNEHRRPQCFYRLPTGEYRISFKEKCAPLMRAVSLLNDRSEPFAKGTSFVHLDRKGAAILCRNELLVHGRTSFINGIEPEGKRVLARKWFMSSPEHAHYKHVPGIHLWPEFASLLPEQFGPEVLYGDWNFDPSRDANVRIS